MWECCFTNLRKHTPKLHKELYKSWKCSGKVDIYKIQEFSFLKAMKEKQLTNKSATSTPRNT